ncbi:DUF4893 domain-containing protein [Brevundimonas sp.]|uniref:DUF4893 domain-containing protein n=1 Tax=Brevundimonas sp. TaxID=1871086 RepID=UPI002FCC6161
MACWRPELRKWMGTTVMTGMVLSVLAGCASVNSGSGTVDVLVPPPPPPPGGAVLVDWRGVISPFDRDRLDRRDAAWKVALEQARRLGGSGNLEALGALVDPTASLPDPAMPSGHYRCRTVKLGSQAEYDGLGYVVYGWFRCRIEATDQGLLLTKLTGSQRVQGLLYPENAKQMVMLGAMALSNENRAPAYGARPDRDTLAVLERIGPQRWRLVTPWPQNESNLDVMELVPE